MMIPGVRNYWLRKAGRDKEGCLVAHTAAGRAPFFGLHVVAVGEDLCRELFEHIEHGDEDHKKWLKDAIHDFFRIPARPEGEKK